MLLSDYLDQNANPEILYNVKHTQLVRDIISLMHELGVAKPYRLFTEVTIKENNKLIGCVDVLVQKGEKIYIIEAKTGKREKELKSKLNIQLFRSYKFFYENFKIEPVLIGVYRIKEGFKHFFAGQNH